MEHIKNFFTQTELIEPQAAQLGIHFFHNTQLEMHLLLRDLIKDNPLVKESRKKEEEKNPSTWRDSNPRPTHYEACSTVVLKPQPLVRST